MTAYTKSTNFATKDTLTSGDPLKIVKGTEINTEFDNIATAVNSKSDTASPTFTGTVTAAALTTTGNTILGDASTDTLNVGNGGLVKDASGNVGIGTTSPASYGKLAVVAPANSTSLGLTDNTQSTLYIKHEATNLLTYEVGGSAAQRWVGNSAERMRIDASGNLLVGTSTTSNTNGVLIGKGGTLSGGIVVLYKTASGLTSGLINYYQSTYVGGVNFDNTSTSFPTSSDKRLKKDISDSSSATQKIDAIRIVSHGWKHDESVVDFGIIAQDLYEILPRAVSRGDDKDEIETVWSVDYSKLVPLLIKAHQEQQALITALTARITALENK